MLQPLQLQDVSTRYKAEISELKDFFQKATCDPGSAESLHSMVHRLQRDRAFHRDLTSHLWVVIDRCKGNISYADLLGMLAIAAAGIEFAAEAQEDDAHALLRFVMEARRSLDGGGGPKRPAVLSPPPPPPAVQPRPVQAPSVGEETMLRPQAHPLPPELSTLEDEDTGASRKHFYWMAACAVAALSISYVAYVLHHRASSDKAGSYTPARPAAAPVSAPAVSEETLPPSPPSEVTSAAPVASLTPKRSAVPPASAARRSYEPAETKPSLSAPRSAAAPAATASAMRPAPSAPPVVPRVSTPLVAHSTPAPAPSVKTTPAAPPASGLGVPSAAAASSTPDLRNTVAEPETPHLLRRHPEEQAALAAGPRSADVPTSRTSAAAAPEAPSGTVRANSVGVHAANVLYSPIPAYPPAASAAHVQGEVKLETDVNRDGHIVSIRVISGPPLLRKAALDAAQRWRYRPDQIGGQSLPISAVTIFEFHLP